MNGLHIQQIWITGVLLGFLVNEEPDVNDHIYTTITICFFFIGIKITIW